MPNQITCLSFGVSIWNPSLQTFVCKSKKFLVPKSMSMITKFEKFFSRHLSPVKSPYQNACTSMVAGPFAVVCSCLQEQKVLNAVSCIILYFKRKFQSQMYLSLLWGQSLEPLSTANSWPPPLAPIKKVKASHCMWYYYFEKVFFSVPDSCPSVRHLFNTRPPPSAPIKNSKHCTDMEPLSPNICIPP